MPNLSQVFDSPRAGESGVIDPNILSRTMARQWTSMAQILNATLKVDVAANKPATPLFNESLFYETDTSLLYLGINGVWVQYPASIYYSQCRLDFVSTTILRLVRYNGTTLTVNGASQTIPVAGVDLSNSGTVASTTYYIYVFMNAGVMTLEYSTTNHSTDATTGMEIKTGDTTRTLVGMARTNGSAAWITQDPGFSGATNIGTLSWFNRRPIACCSDNYAPIAFTSGTPVEFNTNLRPSFLTWGGFTLHHLGTTVNQDTANQNVYLELFYNGSSIGPQVGGSLYAVGTQLPITVGSVRVSGQGEGFYNAGLGGQVTAGTGTTLTATYVVVETEG